MGWIKNRRAKELGLTAILMVISVVVSILLCEGILRLTSYATLLPREGMPRGYYAADHEAGYDLTPSFASSTHTFKDSHNQIWTNSLGCFDTEFSGRQPYIYLTGDSFAWGFSPFESKWGTDLEKLLGIRILKCGVPGYGTRQELAKAEKTLAELPEPSRIVVSYFYNDPSDDAAFPNSLVYDGKLIKNLSGDPSLTYDELQARLPQFAQWAQEYCMWNMPAHPVLQRIKCFLRNHSVLYLLSQSGIKALVPKALLQRVGIVNVEPPSVVPPDTFFALHEENILAFKRLAALKHAPLLIVLIPPKEETESHATSTTYAAQKAFMDEHDIEYLDPLLQFRAVAQSTTTSLYWQSDLHFNPEGNRLFGLLVAEYIAQKTHDAVTLSVIHARLQREFGL
jgi:hypothetical protein